MGNDRLAVSYEVDRMRPSKVRMRLLAQIDLEVNEQQDGDRSREISRYIQNATCDLER